MTQCSECQMVLHLQWKSEFVSDLIHTEPKVACGDGLGLSARGHLLSSIHTPDRVAYH